jgi:hypothetical protein
MRLIRLLAPVAVLLFAAGCRELTVPDYNNPSLEDLQSNPTPGKIATAAQGLLVGTRGNQGAQNGYVSLLGILGRESYNFDAADPRFITEMLISGPDPGSPAFGANLFALPYRNIRGANILLGAVDVVVGMSPAEKEAVRGFAKTIQGLDYLYVINTRDDLGAPLDVNRAPTGEPAPLATKAEIFAHIATLLDEGFTHLQAGGSAFPFVLTSGFTGFATPATFATFNRALKARVEVYRGNHASALNALSASFLNTGVPLTLGTYHSFSTRSGDLINLLFDPSERILAHPSLVTGAQNKPDGTADNRVQQKIVRTPGAPRTVQGITTDFAFTIYPSNTAPIAIIRNEELILLRAEARYFSGDQPGALSDINFIRANSGGLAPRGPFLNNDDFITELLYQRRYSLMFEGGHRWIDARRHGRLNTLPLDLTTHRIFSRFPFPEAECLARVPAPAGCPTT